MLTMNDDEPDIVEVIKPEDVSPWPPRLSFDLATGMMDTEEICEIHQISSLELDNLCHYTPFRLEVAGHKKAIREEGVSFRLKAKIQAEEYLMDLHEIISAPLTPASVKVDAIKYIVKCADLEPSPKVAQNSTTIVNNNKVEICWLPTGQDVQRVIEG